MLKHPLPHDEAIEYPEFQRAFASAMQKARQPVCSLPDTNDAAPAVTAPAVSGQAGGTLRPSRLFALAQQISNPQGFWVSGRTGDVQPCRSFRGQA
jgi:hypothetical protein